MYVRTLIAIIATTSALPCFAQAPTSSTFVDMRTVSFQLPTLYPNVNWITLKEINQSLPNHPVTIGLDIDDTMLFSSSAFYYGKQKYSPQSNEYLKTQEFWDEANTGLDKYSVPKTSAMNLVNLHLQHGDTVFFITGRNAPKQNETLTATLRHLFPLQYQHQIQPVVFANGLEKAMQLKKAGISIFYGDADQDITSAKEAGAKGIRFLRGAQSTNTPLPHAGQYGEPVLVNSNY